MRGGGGNIFQKMSWEKSSSESEIWGVFIEVGGPEGLPEPPEPGVFPFLCLFFFLGKRRLLQIFGWGFGKRKLEDK